MKSRHQNMKTRFEDTLLWITNGPLYSHVIKAFFATAFGFFINYFSPMELFIIKGPIGFALYIFLIAALKYFLKKNAEIKIKVSGDPKINLAKNKYVFRVKNDWNFLINGIAIVYFVTITFLLDFVKMNLIGIYSIFALAFVVFMAFTLYEQYIYFLFLLNDLAKIKSGDYYEIIPERTEWLLLITDFSQYTRYFSIIIGTLFTLLFTIFSPINSIDILFRQGLKSQIFLPLFLTWLIILFAIIIMIPLSGLIRIYYLQRIHNNLKSQAIDAYQLKYTFASNSDKPLYLDVMWRIHHSNLQFSNPFAWALPTIASVVNLTAVVISAISNLKSLGFIT